MSKPMLSASLKQRFKASDLKSLRLRFPALNPQRFENAVICDCEFASLRTRINDEVRLVWVLPVRLFVVVKHTIRDPDGHVGYSVGG